MALQSSGLISLAGNTTGRSVAKELGLNTTATISLGQTNVRALAQRTSGSVGLNHLRGKSAALDTQTVTVGHQAPTIYTPTIYGYGSPSMGAISDGTFNVKSGAAIQVLWWTSFNEVSFILTGIHSNNGWTTMKVGSTTFNRSSANHSSVSYHNQTTWTWTNVTTNPFGTSGTKTVVFN